MIAALALAGLGQTAAACSRVDWNTYSNFGFTLGAELLARSHTIDWISIPTPPPPLCPRVADPNVTPDIGDETLPTELRELCEFWPTEPRLALTAQVKERLKGHSDDRFALFRAGFRPDGAKPGRSEEAVLFRDLRGFFLTGEVGFATRQQAIADARHRTLSFWDVGAVKFYMDGANSCGGDPALDIAMDYIVFRDADGALLATEPVLHDDDALLSQLRLGVRNPGDYGRITLPVEQFFKSADAILLAGVLACSKSGPYYKDEVGRIQILRGEAPPETLWQLKHETDQAVDRPLAPGPNAPAIRFDDLWDYFASRGQPCPVGRQVVLVQVSLPDNQLPLPGLEWFRRRFPDWPMQSPRIKSIMEDWRASYWSNELRPIPVIDGRIRLSDIPTGLTLIGPETIPVNQIFEWATQNKPPIPE